MAASGSGETSGDGRRESEGGAEEFESSEDDVEEGPVHRPLIRATLPRQEGAPPPPRPAPEFTIRQPGGRQNRFRQRPGRGPQQFQSNRSDGGGNGNMGGGGPHRGGMSRQGGGTSAAGRDDVVSGETARDGSDQSNYEELGS